MMMMKAHSWREEGRARKQASHWFRCVSISVCLACLFTVGCRNQAYDVAPVSGRVTLDGKPLADAQVIFQPIAGSDKNAEPGPGSFGSTDADGRYTLETVDPPEPGAVVGNHRVTITTAHHSANPADDSAAAMPKEILPKSCSNGSMRMEVPADGTDKADFAIESR
jgi:hypothetical protein